MIKSRFFYTNCSLRDNRHPSVVGFALFKDIAIGVVTFFLLPIIALGWLVKVAFGPKEGR